MKNTKKLIFWVVLVGAAYWAAGHPYAEWRLRLIGLKLSGELPQIPWSEIPEELKGPLWFERAERPGDQTEGLVVFEREEEGACTHLWKTPLGPFWGRENDENVLEWVIREQYIWSIYQNRWVSVEQGDVVFDVGSHLGAFTRTALDSGAAIVIAFEPEPVNIECFKKTFASELQSGEVVLVEQAAWSSPTTLTFTVEAETHESARARVSRRGEIEVPATTIDATVRDLGLEKVDFIKMDIEGSEKHALEGARTTLERYRPEMALCTYHGFDDAEVLPRLVLEIQPEYSVAEVIQYAYFY